MLKRLLFLTSLLSLQFLKTINGNCECIITEVEGIAETRSSPPRQIHSETSCIQEKTALAYFFSNGFPKEILSKTGYTLVMESCPTDGIINFIEGIVVEERRRRRRLYTREGTRRVLVVRATSKDGYSPEFTAAKLSNIIFDDQDTSMRSRFIACSGGKLRIAPAEGDDISNGVMEVLLNHHVKGVRWKSIQNYVTSELYNRNISIANYDNVIMVLPSEVDFEGAAAFAYIGQHIGVYKDTYIEFQLVMLHEFGHNLGFHHSGTMESSYGDATCFMGGEVTWTRKKTRMCFNASKSWYSNWYSDRQITVIPTTLGLAWNGRLVGIDDYLNDLINEENQQVLVSVTGENETDLFLLFNRAKGVNRDVAGSINKVTIVSQPDDNSPSTLLAGLKAGGLFRKLNWNESGYDLVIQDCGHRRKAVDYAKVRIYLTNKNEDSSCTERMYHEESIETQLTSTCEENKLDRFFLKVDGSGRIYTRQCKWLTKKSKGRVKQLCDLRGIGLGAYDLAHKVCCESCYQLQKK